jgi:hypothetical protein
LNEYDGPLDHDTSNRATVVGTAFKSIVLFAILAVTFGFTWHLSTQGYSEQFAQAKVAAEAAGNKPPDSISIPNNVIGLATGGILVGFCRGDGGNFLETFGTFPAPALCRM